MHWLGTFVSRLLLLILLLFFYFYFNKSFFSSLSRATSNKVAIKRFDPPFIILDFDISQLCVITFMPRFITSQFHCPFLTTRASRRGPLILWLLVK